MASPALPFPDAPPAGPCPDALPTPPCPGAPPTVEAQATLPEHLTEEILLRLPTAADLARASITGPSLRRIIADHSFLRRFRTLHPPPLLCILLPTSFLPAQPPHPSAAAARALADTDFSCSFLPSRERPWIRHDFRDGRALLCVDRHDLSMFRDIAVCDPLHRRYLLLPPVPRYLPDLVDHCEPFLAPAVGDEGTDIAADAPFRFRVMCLAKYQTQLVLFDFSSSGPRAGQWHAVTFDGWSALVAGISDGDDAGSSIDFQNRYYVHGCFYWPIPRINNLLMLNMGTMEFSSVNLPPSPWNNCQMAFVEAREGRLGMFTLNFNPENYAYYLWYTILRSNGEGTRQWQTEDRLTLPHDDYHFKILGVAGGYLLLQAFAKQMWWIPSFQRPKFDSYCFSLDLQTMKLERFCGVRAILSSVGLYAGFPPSLSPPTI